MRVWLLVMASFMGCTGSGPGGSDDCTQDDDCAGDTVCSSDGSCVPVPASCGNGVIDADETCDGALLDGATCSDLGDLSGELRCTSDCSGYDTSRCSPCERMTCSEVGAECGTPGDACGGTLECGGCDGWLSCGVNEPFVCGADCPEGCPPGSTCSDLGVCVGADLSAIVLDVPTIEVSGRITLNGATPTNGPSCDFDDYSTGRVTFTEITHGTTFTVDSTCSRDHAFGPVKLFPGTYDVAVRGVYTDTTDLPPTDFVVFDARSLTADTADLQLDVPTIDVSGSITLNGAAPTNGPSCDFDDYSTGRVTFTEVTRGTRFTVDSTCSRDHAFGPVKLFPGTYDVAVRGVYTDTTDLPPTDFVAFDARSLTADTADLQLDVPTIDVSGSITLNGAPPTNGPSCDFDDYSTGRVTFTEVTRGTRFTVDSTCSRDHAFGPVKLFPGTYDVAVRGVYTDTTDLPPTDFVAFDARSLTADTADLQLDVPTIDVSGSITLNGATPTNGPSCDFDDYSTGRVTFTEVTRGTRFTVDSTCSRDHSFGPVMLFPGTYDIAVRGVYTDTTDLPPIDFVAFDARSLAADAADLQLDVPTIDVSGSITLNGATPTNGPSCDFDDYSTGRVTFTEVTRGTRFTVDSTCSRDHAFGPVMLFPGTYDVAVRGVYTDTTDLPTADFVAADRRELRSDTTGLALDVATLDVAGSVLLDGMMPTNGPSCAFDDYPTARVTFREIDRGYTLTSDSTCTTDHAFGPGSLFPGIYQVSVRGVYSDTTDLPLVDHVAVSRLEVR